MRQICKPAACGTVRYDGGHCEQTISKLGYIAKHPTTGAAISSPYVKMAMDYSKQVTTIWNEIYQIVKENCSEEFSGSPQDSTMELLLRARNRA